MIITEIEVTIFKATIFSQSDNGNKTELYLVKVNHFNLTTTVATNNYLPKALV